MNTLTAGALGRRSQPQISRSEFCDTSISVFFRHFTTPELEAQIWAAISTKKNRKNKAMSWQGFHVRFQITVKAPFALWSMSIANSFSTHFFFSTSVCGTFFEKSGFAATRNEPTGALGRRSQPQNSRSQFCDTSILGVLPPLHDNRTRSTEFCRDIHQ